MGDPRRSHHAFRDARTGFAEATRLLTVIATRPDREAAEAEIVRVLDTSSAQCDEHLQLLVIEERTLLAGIRANAQLAMRALTRYRSNGTPLDAEAMQRALGAVVAGVDRMVQRVEEIEALTEASTPAGQTD